MTVAVAPQKATIEGITRDRWHRYYLDGKGPYPGVTTITKQMDKPWLVGWAQRETAAAAVREFPQLLEHLTRHQRPDTYCGVCMSASSPWNGPEPAAVAWLKRMPGYQRDAAADLGSGVHVIAEKLARKRSAEIAPEQEPFVEAYQRFLAEHKPVFRAVEFYVFHPVLLYGGTVDASAVIDGVLWDPLDYKTGKDVYDEVELQLAGYRGDGKLIAANSGDARVYRRPKGERVGVLHIRPDKYPDTGYRLIPYELDGAWEAFVAQREFVKWPGLVRKNGRDQ